jgi:hypothetical protein
MKFLSAETLKISKEERAALITLLNDLEHYKLPTHLESRESHPLAGPVQRSPIKFHMSNPSAQFDCGTAFCIGGFMQLEMMGKLHGKNGLRPQVTLNEDQVHYITDYVDCAAGQLSKLFYPHCIGDWDRITPQHARLAVENFLVTGKPDWTGVMRHV